MEIEKIEKKIERIEKEIKETPYHKGTEHHIGLLKARLAKLREAASAKTLASRGRGLGFAVKKEGDATVVLVGFPSVGKSTLLNKLTGTKSKVGFYPFTTLEVIPGMLQYKGAKIQIFDIPGLISGATSGKGRGKEVLSVVRIADLLLMMASVENPTAFKIMERELYLAGVRMSEEKPEVLIEKRNRGGIEVSGRPQSISEKTIKALAQEFRAHNAKITIKGRVSQEQLIDAFLGNRVYILTIKILSKIDMSSPERLKKIQKTLGKDCLLLSAKENIGLKELKEEIFKKLNFVRIYLRKSLKARPEKEPLICKKGVTVLEAAKKISGELAQEIKGAKIKGASAKYPNQLVGLNHQLSGRDEVFFVKR